MLLNSGDLWDYVGKVSAICVTTNGVVKDNGKAVMGKGIAAQALERYPGIDATLAKYLDTWGNRPFILSEDRGTSICSFPTKGAGQIVQPEEAALKVCSHLVGRFKYPGPVVGWALKSDLELILKSAELLVETANKRNWTKIVMTVPGAGAGELPADKTLSALSPILDNRFIILCQNRKPND